MNGNALQDGPTMRAFVLLPFDAGLDVIYHDLILPALEAAGYEVRRTVNAVDRQSALSAAIANIAQADLVVAELSVLDGTVMYELGIAHGLLKPTILLTQDIAAVPFDLRSYRLIAYSPDGHEASNLQERLREIARVKPEGALSSGNPVGDFAPRDVPIRRKEGQQRVSAGNVVADPAPALDAGAGQQHTPTPGWRWLVSSPTIRSCCPCSKKFMRHAMPGVSRWMRPRSKTALSELWSSALYPRHRRDFRPSTRQHEDSTRRSSPADVVLQSSAR